MKSSAPPARAPKVAHLRITRAGRISPYIYAPFTGKISFLPLKWLFLYNREDSEQKIRRDI